jgi:LacI family transcriptional regulator
VRAARRERIRDAINELGYVPHGAARALASRKSRMIGALFPTLDNVLFGSFLGPLQQHLGAQGYTLVIASSEYDHEVEYSQFINLVTNGVDGIVLVGMEHNERYYEILNRKQIPYVHTWTWKEESKSPLVGFCNKSASKLAAKYLLDIGHTRFAMISGILEGNDRAKERLKGVKEILAEHNIVLQDHAVIQRPFELSQGASAFRDIMTGKNPPTAVICGSDLFACGAIFEANRMGIRIPEDVSITGFDDTELASSISPTLTTIRTPRVEMAELTAHYLLNRLNNAKASQKKLDVELIVRESTAPPSNRAI